MTAATTGRPVTVNLLGLVEHPAFDAPSPFLVDRDGSPFVPVGDSGVVLGVGLGDPVDATDGEQVVPGVTLVHPDPAARASLTALSCIGNVLTVRTGDAAGGTGWVSGKRGEAGRVVGVFAADVLERMRPGDAVAVRSCGQGWRPAGLDPRVVVMNAAPDLPDRLGITVGPTGGVVAGVAAVLPARVSGNGVGRPAHQWDLALQVVPDGLRIGDLVALDDIDVRHDIGFRRGWRTVGLVVSGASRLPGHGPGLVALVTGPAALVDVRVVTGGPPALTLAVLRAYGTGPAATVGA